MAAVSNISAINVDMPLMVLSPAPTRAKMQSTTETVASEHGTKHPNWANTTVTPTYKVKYNICLELKFTWLRTIKDTYQTWE